MLKNTKYKEMEEIKNKDESAPPSIPFSAE